LKRPLPITLLLLLAVVVPVWLRSYWRYDALALSGWTVGSESGAVYLFRAIEPGNYITGTAGANGRIEIETGSAFRPWVPCWTWEYFSYRIWVVQWWFIAAALALPLAWSWRRRKTGHRGFEVNQPTVPGEQTL
jgi:hypothetical protein